MKAYILLLVHILFGINLLAQEVEVTEIDNNPPDTTHIVIGKKRITITSNDSVDVEIKDEKRKSEAHWAGIEMGFNMLTNASMGTSFPNNPYWENDPARSLSWNWNIFEHKFQIVHEYVGITTGLGISFQQFALKNNYRIYDTPDSVYAQIDTVYRYDKNKLKATYLTVPLLLEFNTNIDADRSFYLAAGVIGSVRIGSKTKYVGEADGNEFKRKDKGTYGLSAFRVDGTVRLGYANWGVFANYSLIPLFETSKTTEVYPLTFGLSYNF